MAHYGVGTAVYDCVNNNPILQWTVAKARAKSKRLSTVLDRTDTERLGFNELPKQEGNELPEQEDGVVHVGQVAARNFRRGGSVTDSDAPNTGVAIVLALPDWQRIEFEDALGCVIDKYLNKYVHNEDELEGAFAVPVGSHRTRLTRRLSWAGMRARRNLANPIHLFWEKVEEALLNKTFFFFNGGREAFFARP